MKGDEKMKNYQLIVAWDDCSVKSEQVDRITVCLTAAAIYMEDPSCCIVHIIDNNKETMVFDWCRD